MKQEKWLKHDTKLLEKADQTREKLSALTQSINSETLKRQNTNDRTETLLRQMQHMQPSLHNEIAQLMIDLKSENVEILKFTNMIQNQIESLYMFIAKEVVAHHNQIAAGLSAEEVQLICDLNPFVPRDHGAFDL